MTERGDMTEQERTLFLALKKTLRFWRSNGPHSVTLEMVDGRVEIHRSPLPAQELYIDFWDGELKHVERISRLRTTGTMRKSYEKWDTLLTAILEAFRRSGAAPARDILPVTSKRREARSSRLNGWGSRWWMRPGRWSRRFRGRRGAL